jgi:hypothetical protein
VASSIHPLVTGTVPVQPDSQDQITIAIKDCSPVDLDLERNYFIGCVENVQDCEIQEINQLIYRLVLNNVRPVGPNKQSVLKKQNLFGTQ